MNKTAKLLEKQLRVGGVETLLFPLPPLNEQKRIVAKINELMALCDHMINKIDRSEQTQEKLLHSVLSLVTGNTNLLL